MIVGAKEIAERLGVKVDTVHQWRKRGALPDPDWSLGVGDVWLWETIDRWAQRTNRTPVADQRDRQWGVVIAEGSHASVVQVWDDHPPAIKSLDMLATWRKITMVRSPWPLLSAPIEHRNGTAFVQVGVDDIEVELFHD